MELSERSRRAIRDIADAAATVRGLTDALVEAEVREDVLGVLLALTVAGGVLRDQASGLYLVLSDSGEEGGS